MYNDDDVVGGVLLPLDAVVTSDVGSCCNGDLLNDDDDVKLCTTPVSQDSNRNKISHDDAAAAEKRQSFFVS